MKHPMIPIDYELLKMESYEDFIVERRKLIAQTINKYMAGLLELQEGDRSQGRHIPVTTIISQGENEQVEFKSTLRWNIRAERNDDKITHSSLKTIAAFLNSEGGTLLIGVNDAGEPVALENDDFENEDIMLLFLTDLIKGRMGFRHLRFVEMKIEAIHDKKVLRIDCSKDVTPVYLKYKNREVFYIRTGPATSELPTREIHDYIQGRFYN